MNLGDFRAQYPAYNDLTDQQLADGLYRRFYADMPRSAFDQRLGIMPAAPASPRFFGSEGDVSVGFEMQAPAAETPVQPGLWEGGATRYQPTLYDAPPTDIPALTTDAPDILTQDVRAGGGDAYGRSVFQAAGDALNLGWLNLRTGEIGRGLAESTGPLLQTMRRIDRGEAVPENDDPVGYQHMAPDQRATFRADTEAGFGRAVGAIQDLSTEAGAIPVPPAVREIAEAKSFGEAWDAFMSDPLGSAGFITLQSAVSSAPSIALGLAGRAVGGVRGLMAGQGAGSAGIEYASSILESFQEGGVDFRDPISVSAAINDPEFMERVRNRAATRAVSIGALDAAAGGLASVPFTRGTGVLARAGDIGGQFAAQAGAGMAGEAIGQVATDEWKPGQILMEGFGEAGTTPIDILAARGGRGAAASPPGAITPPSDATIFDAGPLRFGPDEAVPEPRPPVMPMPVAVDPEPPAPPPAAPAPTPSGPVNPVTGETPEEEAARWAALEAQTRAIVEAEDRRRAETAGPSVLPPGDQPPQAPPPSMPVAAPTPEPVAQPMAFPVSNEEPNDPIPDLGLPQAPDPPTAPMAPPSAEPGLEPGLASARVIRSDTVVTPVGTNVPVEYAVVELQDIIPSQTDTGAPNPAFTGEQPRDRTRAASMAQIAEIAGRLDPRLLDASPTTSDGAPLIGQDGMVDSGNGRILAFRRAYQMGLPSVERYRAHLAEQGYPIEGMHQPILVRINRAPAAQRAQIAAESNARTTLAPSVTEQAMADARIIAPVLSFYRGGDIVAAANREFVRRFVEAAVAPAERGAVVDSQGALSGPGIRRIQAAMLAAAYGDASLIETLVESADNDIKAIGGALVDVAPTWAQMRSEARAGTIDAAVEKTDALLEAVRLVQRARNEGQNLVDLVGQTDFFSGRSLSQTAELFLRFFFRDAAMRSQRSRTKIAEALSYYAEEARKTQPGPGLFGAQPADPSAIIDNARKKIDGPQTQQGDLLARRDPDRPSGGEGVSAPRIDGERGDAVQPADGPRDRGAPPADRGRPDAGSDADPAAIAESAPPALTLQPSARPARGRSASRIEDFGEKLEGARKDYAQRLRDAADIDVAKEPLSKSWPEPDYQQLLDQGADPWTVAFIHAARDEIPTRPQQTWKLTAWVENVKQLRGFAGKLLDGTISIEALKAQLAKREFARVNNAIIGRADLYRAVGHTRSLRGLRLASASYSMWQGQKFNPPRVFWSVERAPKHGENWPRQMSIADSREEAIDKFKTAFARLEPQESERSTTFDIYAYRKGEKANKWWIGKKIGTNRVDLKSFETVKEARAYLNENRAELERMLDRFRNVPNERKAENSPRVGADHRNGTDVTPEIFGSTFGFRGVQFGNWVEGDRRQQNINEAFDALMDLAGVLGIPPRALSLNGELGLAFGARGRGGKGAAAAHYEPSQIVINLTKNQGAGSLAHEWWHAADNYFSRRRDEADDFVTERPYFRKDGVRPEMVAAFKGVIDAIRETGVPARSADLDRRRTKAYWSTNHEMSARAFEAYIIAKLQDQGASNDYLANIVSEQMWNAAAALGVGESGVDAPSYPYPITGEMAPLRAAFDHFFTTIESRETDRGVELYQTGNRPTGAEDVDVEALAREIQRLVPGVDLAALPSLPRGNNASYLRGLIKVALSGPDPMNALRHEAIHALRDFGLIRKEEWRRLSEMAAKKWMAKYEIERRYPNLDRDAQIEEAVAEAFADHQATPLPDGFRGIWKRIKDFLDRLAPWWREKFGNLSPEDVFDRVERGDVGGRQSPGRTTTRPAAAQTSTIPTADPDALGPATSLDSIRVRALRYAKQHLFGREFVNDEQGMTIRVNRTGIEKVTSHGRVPEQAVAIAAIPELIRQGKLDRTDPDYRGDSNLDYLTFTSPLHIGDRTFDVTFTVRRGSGGTFYYDHSLMEMSERSTAERVGGISEEKLHDYPAAERPSENIGPIDGDDNADEKLQTAWHGSPHDFDRFSKDRIGSGEGAQSFGHGLYFAGKREVAEWYRRNLSARHGGGVQIPSEVMAALEGLDYLGFDSASQALAEIRRHKDDWRQRWDADFDADSTAHADAIDAYIAKPLPSRGRLYRVDLAPAEDEYLLWDKPLSEQSEKVRAALSSMGFETIGRRIDPEIESDLAHAIVMAIKGTPVEAAFGSHGRYDILAAPDSGDGRVNIPSIRAELKATPDRLDEFDRARAEWRRRTEGTGEDFYKTLSGDERDGDGPRDPSLASELLREAGIRGIKYLDGSSRRDGDGTYNYVIFDDADVSIEEKFQTPRPDPAKDGDELADALATEQAEAVDGPRSLGRARSFMDDDDKVTLPRTPDMNFLARAVVHPRTIAIHYPAFAPVYRASVKLHETRDRIVSDLSRRLEPYARLSGAEKRRVNAVLEIGRLAGEVYAGKTIAATNRLRDTDLSKFKEQIVLTAAERDGYLAVRQTMDHALDLMSERVLAEWGHDKAGSPKTAAEVRAAAKEGEKTRAEMLQSERLATILAEIEEAKRVGYVPFSRFGHIGLAVKDSLGQTVHFEKIDTDRIVGPMIGRRLHQKAVAARRADLKKQYPLSQGYTVTPPIDLRQRDALSNNGVNLSDIDVLAELGNVDSEMYSVVREAIAEGLKKASFRKHFIEAKNTAGYSADFERSIADYVTGIAGYIARREHEAEMDDAVGMVAASGRQPKLTHYARKYVEYINSPITEWQMLRQAAFLYYLTSPATGMVNLSQVPIFSASYMAGLTNPGRVAAELTKAYADAAKMLSISKLNPESGIEAFDPAKAPEDVRAALQAAFDDGYLVPQMTYEQMATATGTSPRLRGLSKNARTAMDALAAFYTITERTNRITTFIAAYRLAKRDPAVLKALDEQQKGNTLYSLEVGTANPEKAARWITDETQFKVGKVNRPELLRGFGSFFFQFRGFILQALELQYRQLRKYHGRGAKTALAVSVAGIILTAGLFGFPGAEDLKELAEFFYRYFSKQDIDIEKEVRMFIYEMTGATWLSESAARGLGRLTGIDFAKRIGMGDVLPNITSDWTGTSVAIDLLIGRAHRIKQHLERGDRLNALAELFPALIANPIKAIGMLTSGVRSVKTGRTIMTPDQVTAGDAIQRGFGFTSARIARRREAEYATSRSQQSIADLRSHWYTQMGRALADKVRAERAKNADASIEAVQRYRRVIEEIQHHNQRSALQDRFAPQRSTLDGIIRQELSGADGKKTPKRMRGERARIREVYGVEEDERRAP